MAIYYNVLGKSATGGTSNTTELIAPYSGTAVTNINICNIHASADATVTLFIQNDPQSGTTNTYNFVKSVSIPFNAPLLISIPKFKDEYGLYITVGASDTVDVILN